MVERAATLENGALVEIGYRYANLGANGDSEAIEAFHATFVESLYEYLDEQLDYRRLMLALLRRYKHKCEWFQRATLYEQWMAETQQGEKRLALHLYEYLHDQGLDFYIEPRSISGSVDLIAAQHTDDPLVADAKIFCPDKGKGRSYLAAAVQQIYTYLHDFNEPVGYLVIFRTGEHDLRLCLDSAGETPFLMHNHKALFFVVIDIYPHDEPASKRGRLEAVEVKAGDLIRFREEPGTDPASGR